MEVLKNRLTRIIVFVVAVALVCGCTLSGVNTILKYENFNESQSENYSYTEYSDELSRLHADLWAFANIYIRNLDENGSLDPDSYKTPYIKEAMKFAGFDVDRNVVINKVRENFDYYVGLNGIMAYSSADAESFPLDEYTLYVYENAVMNVPSHLIFSAAESYGYTNGKGFHYYYLGNYDRGFAVYDYDTSGLDSYIDDKGAVIYLNEDGSSPIPTAFRQDGEFTADSDYVPVFYEDTSTGLDIRIRPKDNLLAQFSLYDNARQQMQQEVVDDVMALIPFGILILILTVYLLLTAGYDSKEKKYKTSGFDRIFAEIAIAGIIILVVCIAFMLTFEPASALDRMLSSYGYFETSFRLIYTIGIGGGYALIVALTSSIILRIRCREVLKTSLIFIILRKIFTTAKKCCLKLREYFRKQSISRQLLRDNEYIRRFIWRTALFVTAGAILLPLQIAARFIPLIILTLLILIGAFMFFCIKDLKELIPLSQHIRRISDGDYSEFDVAESSATYGMHKNLNHISSGMQSAVEEQLKSERMKIDLVTNVSHDLKTPLTSIISYIDLLSKEELSSEARDYVTVLENKSAKLKSMVSDVFDLAKATSRTDVAAERLDAVILVDQVLGDMSDKIDSSGMEIRKIINADSAPVLGDGKKLYRVMQNLIDNALTYSLAGTRIYITLDLADGNTVIKVQNISSYEMSFRADEITERFVRGDEARTTEGNGLGLSIAKSYTEACGGSFRVEILGDSFAAFVTLPLINENKN